MIATKNRRPKTMKLSKNLERLYKERKCRECAVVMTRMDFARILGKFTKVKIQYESVKSPKGKLGIGSSTNPKSRLKSNENGLLHRNNLHPVKDSSRSKKSITHEFSTPNSVSNILKENNRLKESILKDKNANYDKMSVSPSRKRFGIIFTSPVSVYKNEYKSKISLAELLPDVDDGILPSEEWCIDYFPKNDEPKDDKVYDRIAAELEDLMNSGKPLTKTETKSDEFPSILDILNDNSTDSTKPTNQSISMEIKSNLDSCDVEAMLLGKPDAPQSELDAVTPMDVDNPDVSNLIADVEQFNPIPSVEPSINLQASGTIDELDNPHSPSILDEALQKGVEEHLPPGSHIKSIAEESKENETESLNNTIVNNDTSLNDMKEKDNDEDCLKKMDVDEGNLKKTEDDEDSLEEKKDDDEDILKNKDNDKEIFKNKDSDEEILKNKENDEDILPNKENDEDILPNKENDEDILQNKENDEDILKNQENDEDILKKKDDNENISKEKEDEEVLLQEKDYNEVNLEINNDDEISTKKSDIKNIKNNNLAAKAAFITQVVFKKIINGECYKSVTCPKNLKYSVELEGQAVELIGAPKFVTSFEDLQVLLQIVNESELKSFHVLH